MWLRSSGDSFEKRGDDDCGLGREWLLDGEGGVNIRAISGTSW